MINFTNHTRCQVITWDHMILLHFFPHLVVLIGDDVLVLYLVSDFSGLFRCFLSREEEIYEIYGCVKFEMH